MTTYLSSFAVWFCLVGMALAAFMLGVIVGGNARKHHPWVTLQPQLTPAQLDAIAERTFKRFNHGI